MKRQVFQRCGSVGGGYRQKGWMGKKKAEGLDNDIHASRKKEKKHHPSKTCKRHTRKENATTRRPQNE